MKKGLITFSSPPVLTAGMSVVGKREGEGPLGGYFDLICHDEKFGEKTFEKGEANMFSIAVSGALSKTGLQPEDVDVLIAGDLLNQLVSSSYVARDLPMSYLGVYSACSTMTESLIVGGTLISSGYADRTACATGSHFATAERQYRYPLEYGCQRPPYSQWTVTAAGCSILAKKGNGPSITHAAIGHVVDMGVSDLNNMGAGMAPAAADTMCAVFEGLSVDERDFDLILTGDLGRVGSEILRDLMRERNVELGSKYSDCGEMIFYDGQHCYSGGSGAGCSACVLNSYVLKKMACGELNRVLLLATGALMSPTTSCQGETIPAVSHGVILENI